MTVPERGPKERTKPEALKRKLAEHAQDLAIDLFDQPSKQTRSELRQGSKGSLVVKLYGPRRGEAYRFAYTRTAADESLDRPRSPS